MKENETRKASKPKPKLKIKDVNRENSKKNKKVKNTKPNDTKPTIVEIRNIAPT